MAKPPNQTEYYAPIHPKRERAVPPAKRKNFKLREVREVLEDAGYSPAEAMLRIAEQAELSSQDESYEISTRRAFVVDSSCGGSTSGMCDSTTASLSRNHIEILPCGVSHADAQADIAP